MALGDFLLVVCDNRVQLGSVLDIKIECEPMPNVIALPNIGGALCSTPQFG